MADAGLLFFLLLGGHALADQPLQTAWLSAAKRRFSTEGRRGVWLLALGGHGLIHGAFVAALTGSWVLGVAETAAHALIDFAKCERKIGLWTDQGLHVLCKAVWVVIALDLLAKL